MKIAHRLVCVAGVVLALTACSPTDDLTSASPSPTGDATTQLPTDPRQASYERAVREWSLPLPRGFAWPEEAPRDFASGGFAMAGDELARRLWGCSVIDAAWAAADAGDIATAKSTLDLLDLDDESWDLSYYDVGWINPARTSGDSGLCLQWLDDGRAYPDE